MAGTDIAEAPIPDERVDRPGHDYGRFSRIMRGVFALSLQSGANIASQLLLVPIALAAWGTVRFGEWLSITALVSFLAFTDLGLQTYVTNRLTAHFARGDRHQFLKDLYSTLWVQLPLVTALWIGTTACLFVLPLNQWLRIGTTGRLDLRVTVALLSAELLAAVPFGIIAGTYRALGHLPFSAFFGAVQRSVGLAVSLILISIGSPFYVVAAGRLLVFIGSGFVLLRDLRGREPWIRFEPSLGSWRLGLLMIGPGIAFVLVALADYLTGQGLVVLLQHFRGGADVTVLSTHRTVANCGRMIAGLLTAAVWPEITALNARGERGRLISLSRSLSRISGWVVGLSLVLLFSVLQWLFPLWTLRHVRLDMHTLIVLALDVAIGAVWGAAAMVLSATNHQVELLVALVADAAVVTAAAAILIPRYGILGAAYAGLLGNVAVCSWLVPLLACRVMGDTLSAFVRHVYVFFTATVVVPVTVGATIVRIMIERGLALATGSAVAALLSTMAALALFNVDERAKLYMLIRRAARL